MRRYDRSTLDSFQRVKEFLTQHPLADAPDAPDAPDALGAQAAELDDVIQRLSSEVVGQHRLAHCFGFWLAPHEGRVQWPSPDSQAAARRCGVATRLAPTSARLRSSHSSNESETCGA